MCMFLYKIEHKSNKYNTNRTIAKIMRLKVKETRRLNNVRLHMMFRPALIF